MTREIKQSPQNRRIFRMVIKELTPRVEAIISHMPEEVAKQVLADVEAGAPDGIAGYPGMLQLRRLTLPGIDSTVGIIVPGYAHSQRLRSVDVKRTVLYVRPRIIRGEANPAAVVLARKNPWTMETLPYEPHRSEASILSRRVTETEARKIEVMRRSERPGVDRELRELGVRPMRVHPVLIQRRVSRDIAFEVLRYEFGVNVRAQSHWRPAIRAARSRFVTQSMKRMIRWLATPSERRWKRSVLAKPGKASEAKRIQVFQRHVSATR